MAFFDWNHNGKKDIQDDFLEYNIYKDFEQKRNNNYSSGKGISHFGACCGTVLTIIIAAAFAGGLGLEGTPLVIVFIIFAIIIGAVIGWFFDGIGF